MITFDVARWALPVKESPVNWGYGTALVAVPGTALVVLSLPTGGPRSPWCVVDLASGEVRRGTGMPGYLRAILFPHPEFDQDPWVLGAYGLGRLRLGDRPAVTDVVRKGIGKYQTTLIDVDRELLGVGHFRNASMLLVSKSDGLAVKRIRVPGPSVGYLLANGRFRVVGFHRAQACDINLDGHRVVARNPLPYGKGAIHHGGELIAVLGDRHDIRIVDHVSEAEPGATVVLRAGQPESPPDAGMPLGWDVLPGAVAVLDAETLHVRQRVPMPRESVEVLGVDCYGRIVVSTQHGFFVLDPNTSTVVATYEQPGPILGAAFCPSHNVVGLLGGDHTDDSLYAIRW